MKSIWIVEQGENDDYSVVGIYSTKANADTVAKKINASEPTYLAEVVERPLDPGVEELVNGMTVHTVHMLPDGTVQSVTSTSELSGYDVESKHHTWRKSNLDWYRGAIPHHLKLTMWALNSKDAIKKADKLRLHLIAAGEWNE